MGIWINTCSHHAHPRGSRDYCGGGGSRWSWWSIRTELTLGWRAEESQCSQMQHMQLARSEWPSCRGVARTPLLPTAMQYTIYLTRHTPIPGLRYCALPHCPYTCATST